MDFPVFLKFNYKSWFLRAEESLFCHIILYRDIFETS